MTAFETILEEWPLISDALDYKAAHQRLLDKNVNLSLATVKQYLPNVRSAMAKCASVADQLYQKIAGLEATIQELQSEKLAVENIQHHAVEISDLTIAIPTHFVAEPTLVYLADTKNTLPVAVEILTIDAVETPVKSIAVEPVAVELAVEIPAVESVAVEPAVENPLTKLSRDFFNSYGWSVNRDAKGYYRVAKRKKDGDKKMVILHIGKKWDQGKALEKIGVYECSQPMPQSLLD